MGRFLAGARITYATERHRILIANGRRYTVYYRYETWVQFISRPTMPRVDLSPLAKQLSEKESGGTWTFDHIEDPTPRLHPEGTDGSSLSS